MHSYTDKSNIQGNLSLSTHSGDFRSSPKVVKSLNNKIIIIKDQTSIRYGIIKSTI